LSSVRDITVNLVIVRVHWVEFRNLSDHYGKESRSAGTEHVVPKMLKCSCAFAMRNFYSLFLETQTLSFQRLLSSKRLQESETFNIKHRTPVE
jgi:hypothetical protein